MIGPPIGVAAGSKTFESIMADDADRAFKRTLGDPGALRKYEANFGYLPALSWADRLNA
jgi:hypothetical protein